jgi:hypothetical protein
MATQVQLRRGNTSQTNAFTGAVAEITIDTDKETVVVHDGATAGGFALARESAVSSNSIFAQAAFNTANAAFASANISNGVDATQNNTITAAFLAANAATATDTTQNNSITAAFNTANAAFTVANSAVTSANGTIAWNTANASFLQANAAFTVANNAVTSSNGSIAWSTANSAASYANSAFVAANSAGVYANSAFAAANAASATDTTQNNSITAAFASANAAFTRANNSLNANTGGTVAGDVSITGNLTVTGLTTYTNTTTVLIADNIITVNAAISQSAQPTVNAGIEVDRGAQPNSSFLWIETSGKWAANNGNGSIFIAADSAETYANAAFLAANSANATDLTQNNSITAAFATANAAFLAANAATATDTTQNNSITAAFNTANAAFTVANTDYTTISATAGVYGNASHVSVTTLTANGRVSSITNTAIAISADAITSGTLSNTRGGTGTTSSTGTGSVVLGTAPTITLPTINNIRQGYSTTVTAAGTTSLTVNSNYLQFFTGTTTQILTLPAPQTMTLGMGFFVVNNSTGNIEVRASNAAAVATILAGTAMLFVSIDLTAGNGAAGWSAEIVGFSTITGTGAAVLNTSPTLSNVSVTGAITASGNVRADYVVANTAFASAAGLSKLELTDIGLAAIRVAGETYQFGASGIESNQGVFGGSFGGNRLSLNNETNLISNRYDTVKIQTGTDGTTVNDFIFANNSLTVPGLFTTVSTNITSTTASTSNTTGALKVAGGVGVKGNVSTDGIIFPDNTRQTTAAVGGGASIGDVLALSIALG